MCGGNFGTRALVFNVQDDLIPHPHVLSVSCDSLPDGRATARAHSFSRTGRTQVERFSIGKAIKVKKKRQVFYFDLSSTVACPHTMDGDLAASGSNVIATVKTFFAQHKNIFRVCQLCQGVGPGQ